MKTAVDLGPAIDSGMAIVGLGGMVPRAGSSSAMREPPRGAMDGAVGEAFRDR